jgi:hypothetical protein
VTSVRITTCRAWSTQQSRQGTLSELIFSRVDHAVRASGGGSTASRHFVLERTPFRFSVLVASIRVKSLLADLHRLSFPPLTMNSFSKKEYFLAQIREKDAIIESLIKEVSALLDCRRDTH